MSEKKNVETEDYQFIREKIVTQKKNRYKRWIFSAIGVVVLAVVFGLVARITFVKSGQLVDSWLGITPTSTPNPITRTPITIPPVTNTSVPTPSLSPTPTPTDIPEVTPEITPEPENTDINSIISFFKLVSDVATKSTKFMCRVVYVKTSVDWFGEILETDSVGSGVIIGDNGVELLMLVESARASAADRIDIVIAGRRIKDVKLSASNSEYGLAVIALPLEELTAKEKAETEYAVFGDSASVTVGTPVIAIGSPNGYFGSFEMTTVTSRGENVYVTDNSLAIYNTGITENIGGDGVLVNLSGQLVGIITHSFKEENNSNVLSMVGINNIKYMIQCLANSEGWNYLGLVVKEAPQSVLEKNEIKNGLYVTEVKEGSPAEAAGIRKGDIITSLDGNAVTTVDAFAGNLEKVPEGKIYSVNLIRAGELNKGVLVTVTKK